MSEKKLKELKEALSQIGYYEFNLPEAKEKYPSVYPDLVKLWEKAKGKRNKLLSSLPKELIEKDLNHADHLKKDLLNIKLELEKDKKLKQQLKEVRAYYKELAPEDQPKKAEPKKWIDLLAENRDFINFTHSMHQKRRKDIVPALKPLKSKKPTEQDKKNKDLEKETLDKLFHLQMALLQRVHKKEIEKSKMKDSDKKYLLIEWRKSQDKSKTKEQDREFSR